VIVTPPEPIVPVPVPDPPPVRCSQCANRTAWADARFVAAMGLDQWWCRWCLESIELALEWWRQHRDEMACGALREEQG